MLKTSTALNGMLDIARSTYGFVANCYSNHVSEHFVKPVVLEKLQAYLNTFQLKMLTKMKK